MAKKLNAEEKVDYAGGEINALMPMIAALIYTHPDPQRLRNEFHRLKELQVSLSLPRRVTEHFLQGQEARHADLEGFLAKALGKQS